MNYCSRKLCEKPVPIDNKADEGGRAVPTPPSKDKELSLEGSIAANLASRARVRAIISGAEKDGLVGSNSLSMGTPATASTGDSWSPSGFRRMVC
jgi:hypothetical protein